MIRWIIIAALLLLLGVTSWIHSTLIKEDSTVKVKDRGEPDSQMWNFTRTEMDEDGQLKARLNSVHMRHYPLDDSVEFDKPRMEIFNEKGTSPWFIVAERGWLSGDGEKLLLYGDVFIWRYTAGQKIDADIFQRETADDEQSKADLPEKQIELITTDLKILLEEEYAETENFVTMINKTTKVTSTGMQFNMKKRHLKLLNKVKGRYENP